MYNRSEKWDETGKRGEEQQKLGNVGANEALERGTRNEVGMDQDEEVGRNARRAGEEERSRDS